MTLFAQVGRALYDVVRSESITIVCDEHGLQPAILACACIEDLGVAEATMNGVYCPVHVTLFIRRKDAGDDDVDYHCFACLSRLALIR